VNKTPLCLFGRALFLEVWITEKSEKSVEFPLQIPHVAVAVSGKNCEADKIASNIMPLTIWTGVYKY
jgi:hypothetical protein